jgi:hypothetical protein
VGDVKAREFGGIFFTQFGGKITVYETAYKNRVFLLNLQLLKNLK